MSVPVVEMLIPIAFFAMIVLVVYFTMRFSYQTKKAIIDSGREVNFSKKTFPYLEIGLAILGIGLGLAFAVIPMSMDIPDIAREMLTGSFVLLFAGLGLVTAFFIRRRLER